MRTTHGSSDGEDPPEADDAGRRLAFDLRPTARRRAGRTRLTWLLWALVSVFVVLLAVVPVWLW